MALFCHSVTLARVVASSSPTLALLAITNAGQGVRNVIEVLERAPPLAGERVIVLPLTAVIAAPPTENPSGVTPVMPTYRPAELATVIVVEPDAPVAVVVTALRIFPSSVPRPAEQFRSS